MSIPFNKQFKKGDIICSDEFHSGKCMVVEEECSFSIVAKDYRYRCLDLIEENQGWSAFEFDSFSECPNNWRLATDDDISAYLERYITTREEDLGQEVNVAITDDLLTIKDVCGNVYLDMKQAAKLRDYLYKYVVGG